MHSEKLIEAVAVTAELCGRVFSPAAARVFVEELSRYPEHQVLASLSKCRREVRGVLTLQDVISRLDDGRPGADEAWACIPRDESGSVVWSEEMAQAFNVALPALQEGDQVSARMAFKEAYNRLVSDARSNAIPPVWSPSLGHDPKGREAALQDAVRLNRISIGQARTAHPMIGMDPEPDKRGVDRIAGVVATALPLTMDAAVKPPSSAVVQKIRALRLSIAGDETPPAAG
jgi:hypothetical protein